MKIKDHGRREEQVVQMKKENKLTAREIDPHHQRQITPFSSVSERPEKHACTYGLCLCLSFTLTVRCRHTNMHYTPQQTQHTCMSSQSLCALHLLSEGDSSITGSSLQSAARGQWAALRLSGLKNHRKCGPKGFFDILMHPKIHWLISLICWRTFQNPFNIIFKYVRSETEKLDKTHSDVMIYLFLKQIRFPAGLRGQLPLSSKANWFW